MVSPLHRVVVLLAVALTIGPAIAQRGSRTIMRGNADGTHEVLMLTSPDYAALRTPDFKLADLALIKKTLVMSDEQAEFVADHIEQYLTAFRALTKSFAAETSREAEYIPAEEKESETPKPGADEGWNVRLDDLNLPSDVNVSVGMSTSRSRSDDPEVPAPPPEVKVSVMLDSPEGDEVPQETIETIRRRANAVAENTVTRMMVEEAARAAGQPESAKPVFEADDNFDTMKADHDALLEKVDRFIKDKAKLRAQLVIESQTILAEEQVARWPALERALYRQVSLPKGELPGESVDVIDLIDRLKLTDEQLKSIASDLESFDIALDSALRNRDRLLSTATQKVEEAIANKKPDVALSLTDRVTAARLAVRTINQTHSRVFVELLGTEKGAEFWRSVQTASYPRVFVSTRGEKMFISIDRMKGIDGQLVATITSLHDDYALKLGEINEQLRATIDRESATSARRGIEHLKNSMEGTPSTEMNREDPVRAQFVRRAELDDYYIKLVADLLGPEQVKDWPRIRKNRDPIRIESDSGS